MITFKGSPLTLQGPPLRVGDTMPGFTPISMYPQMWAAAGLSYPDLLSELLTEASQRPLGLR